MPRARIERRGETTWIEGVPALTGWKKLPTFAGALEAALSVTEHPVDYTDLLGLSGLAFRTRWYVGEEGPTGCMCSPTGETPMVWSALARGTGWQLEPFDGDGWKTPGMRRLVPRIVDAIDAGRPVVAVDQDLNSSVLYGHKLDWVTFLARTYYAESVVCEVSELGQNPALAVFLREYLPPPPATLVLHGVLRDAVSAWQHEHWDTAVSSHLRSGRAALLAWIEFYDRLDEMAQRIGKHSLLAHAIWNYRHLCQARQAAAGYLARVADRPPEGAEETQETLRQASAVYQREADLLATAYDGSWGRMPELVHVFFERCHTSRNPEWRETPIDAWDETIRQRERSILARALQIEGQAMVLLETALSRIG